MFKLCKFATATHAAKVDLSYTARLRFCSKIIEPFSRNTEIAMQYFVPKLAAQGKNFLLFFSEFGGKVDCNFLLNIFQFLSMSKMLQRWQFVGQESKPQLNRGALASRDLKLLDKLNTYIHEWCLTWRLGAAGAGAGAEGEGNQKCPRADVPLDCTVSHETTVELIKWCLLAETEMPLREAKGRQSTDCADKDLCVCRSLLCRKPTERMALRFACKA